jgi:hypothetical protein
MDLVAAVLLCTKGGSPYQNQSQPSPHSITVPEVLTGSTIELNDWQIIGDGDLSTNQNWM